MLVAAIVLAILIISIAIQLASRRKDKYRRIIHSVFYRSQRPGSAWGLGPWYYGAWDVKDEVNEAISAGRRQGYARRSHHSQHKKSKHK